MADIKLLIFDIDGVLTDGTLIIDCTGREQKRVNLKDVDAVHEFHRRGYKLAAVTGEDAGITAYFKSKFPWDRFISGCKTKLDKTREIAIELGVSMEETAFVGDGKYDLEVLPHVGLSVCPNDAIPQIKRQADIVLSKNAGAGCVWELLTLFDKPKLPDNDAACCFHESLTQHQLMFKEIASNKEFATAILSVAKVFADRLKAGSKLFFCGNGGSAADAQHIAAEFIGRFYKERAALPAEALTTNTSVITAIGNDYGFEFIFARQLEAKAVPGDILTAISTSGMSANVIEALKYARNNGLISVLLTGENPPHKRLAGVCDYIISVPSQETPRIQEAHGFLGHFWADYVENVLFGE